MQKTCMKGPENQYYLCRKAAAVYNDTLNSRAGAADELGVSESSLRNYELGLSPVPLDVVVRMADLYGAPELRAGYCNKDCPIGRQNGQILADEVKGISEVTCSLLRHVEESTLKSALTSLIKIASDGKVNADEKSELESIIITLEYISRDISNLRLIAEKSGGHGS